MCFLEPSVFQVTQWLQDSVWGNGGMRLNSEASRELSEGSKEGKQSLDIER